MKSLYRLALAAVVSSLAAWPAAAQSNELFEEIRARLNLAMLFITHDLRVASQVWDMLAVISQGRVVEHGPAQRVFGSPPHDCTGGLIAAAPGRDFAFGA